MTTDRASRLAGRTALVTGAAGGIGGAIARRFAAEGARVLASDRASALADEGVAVAAGMTALPMELSDPEDIERAVETVGPIDILVACGAMKGGVGRFPEISLADWDRYITVNLTGVFLLCRAVARRMIAAGRGGRIVTVGSVNSIAAEPDALPYATAKGGVALLTRAMAVDLAPHAITVNMLAPGPISVPKSADHFGDPRLIAELAREVALGRVGLPEECAGAALLLASDDASYMTGSTITIDGGMTAMIFGGMRNAHGGTT